MRIYTLGHAVVKSYSLSLKIMELENLLNWINHRVKEENSADFITSINQQSHKSWDPCHRLAWSERCCVTRYFKKKQLHRVIPVTLRASPSLNSVFTRPLFHRQLNAKPCPRFLRQPQMESPRQSWNYWPFFVVLPTMAAASSAVGSGASLRLICLHWEYWIRSWEWTRKSFPGRVQGVKWTEEVKTRIPWSSMLPLPD